MTSGFDEGPGREFGAYRLLTELGRGGMGEVWRALDTDHGRTVALKRLATQWSDRPEFRARFHREARATAALNSPHVITIHDYGQIDGQLYIDMALITGGDLATLLTHQPEGLEPTRAIQLTEQIAQALSTAHRAGLIHRDVKPSNILLDPDPTHDHAYLVDFGIAKLADDTSTTTLTTTGTTLGTPAYMAPELFTSATAATPASDVYALGCVLFELLTGHRPYTAPTTAALIGQHLHEPIPHPSDTHPALAAYDPVITRALAKTPDQRYPTPHTLTTALHHASIAPGHHSRPESIVVATGLGEATEGPVGEPEGTTRSRSAPLPTSRRGLVVLVVLVLLAVGVGVLTWSHVAGTDLPPGVTATGATGPLLVPVALDEPQSVAFSHDGRRAYVTQTGDDTLSVIDTAAGHEIAHIPTPEGAGSIAISGDDTRAYIGGLRPVDDPGTHVTVVDTTTNSVIGTAAAGLEPQGVALSLDDRRLFVANNGTVNVLGATVSVIDTANDALIATIPAGATPTQICRSPDGARLYVPDIGLGSPTAGAVVVIDTATDRTNDLRVGDAAPVDCALSPDGRQLYLVTLGPPHAALGSIRAVDTSTGADRELDHGAVTAPYGLALSPDGRLLVVADYGLEATSARTVTVLDTATGNPRQTFTLPGRPTKVAVRPDGREAWVTTVEPGGVWRIPLP